jgi:hypothetical protein
MVFEVSENSSDGVDGHPVMAGDVQVAILNDIRGGRRPMLGHWSSRRRHSLHRDVAGLRIARTVAWASDELKRSQSRRSVLSAARTLPVQPIL